MSGLKINPDKINPGIYKAHTYSFKIYKQNATYSAACCPLAHRPHDFSGLRHG